MHQTQGFNDCNVVDSEKLMEPLRRKLLLAVFLGPSICAWGADTNQDDLEYQLKATFLYKFASYVEWPATAFAQTNTFFTIGVVGADKVVVALNSLTGAHPVNNRPLQVKVFKQGEPITDVQILFIGKQENGHLKHLLSAMQSQPILVVTESAGALEAGSIINFVPVDDRIRFEISVTQAERSGLKISSRLLGVAQKIESGKP
jgi:hypothetical protein